MLSGSIASLGTQYVLTLNASNCQTGDSLAQEQAEASSKEQVLAALGGAVSKMRGSWASPWRPFKRSTYLLTR